MPDQPTLPQRLHVVHVINCLDTGGAETMLARLLGEVAQDRFRCEVISLTDLGDIADLLRRSGIAVSALGMRRASRLPPLGAWLRLVAKLRRMHPDVIHCWMYHSNLLTGLAALLAGRPPLVWSIRQTNLDRQSVRLRTSLTARLGAWLSRRLPARILYNSHVARLAHARLGYRDDIAVVVPNGFDPEAFRPDSVARAAVREELGLPPDAVLIGIIARFDPQKDHETFIRAAGQVLADRPGVHCLLAGLDIDPGNDRLNRWIAAAGIAGRCHLLGHRRDIPRLVAALDLSCSSSMGEGFPNAVGEAMATGVPCVVTDVGDSALLVGETGLVVPPGDPGRLAEALARLIDAGPERRREIGAAARTRICNEFSLPAIARRFEALWKELA